MKKFFSKEMYFILAILNIISVIVLGGILAFLTDTDRKNNVFILEDADSGENNQPGGNTIENGKLSNADPGEHLTVYFPENISLGDIIRYTTRVDDVTYGPYSFLYTEEEQSVKIKAHTDISCTLYNDRITATYYRGAWKDIYFDMETETLPFETFLSNGKISSEASEEYLTANFSKNITLGSYIKYTTTVDGEIYGPFYFRYTEQGQGISIGAHTSISCSIYDDKITATHYPGAWKDIYIDMEVGTIASENVLQNGQISNSNPGEYLTANFSKNIQPGNFIIYTTRVDNEVYGPYCFQYTKEEQSISITAHRNISCTIYNDKIMATGYSGAWKDIYIDIIAVEF